MHQHNTSWHKWTDRPTLLLKKKTESQKQLKNLMIPGSVEKTLALTEIILI